MDAELKELVEKLQGTVMSKFLRSEDCINARTKIIDDILKRVLYMYEEEMTDKAAQLQELQVDKS